MKDFYPVALTAEAKDAPMDSEMVALTAVMKVASKEHFSVAE